MAKAKARPSIDKNAKLPYLEQRVPVFLAREDFGENHPVRLQNGTDVCYIERGKTVMVKRKFALQLEEAARGKNNMLQTLEQMKKALDDAAKQSDAIALNK